MTDTQCDSIILNQDVEGLLALSDSEKDDLLDRILWHYLPFKSLNEMNEVQKTLYLASTLEDTCQADALPSLSENPEIFLALPEIKKSYETLGALKTAALLDELISLLPAGIVPEWDWFFEGATGEIIERIDSEICNYPDGVMHQIYVTYISDPQIAAQLLMDLTHQ